MRLKAFLIFFSYLLSLNIKAQDSVAVYGVKLSYTYARLHNPELGFAVGHIFIDDIEGIAVGYYDGYCQFGYAQYNSTSLMSSKVGIELCSIIGGRISICNYSNFHHDQTCLLPEIGLSGFGRWGSINIMYGYNFNLSKSDIFDVEGNQFNVCFSKPLFTFKRKRK
jgi:hypothetical protein